MTTNQTTAARLEYLRGQLRAGCASYGELAELQDLAPHIPADDVELLEAAGVPEFDAPPNPGASDKRPGWVALLRARVTTYGTGAPVDDIQPAELLAEIDARTEAAAAMLQACQAGLHFIENRFIADHGQRDIGEAWAALVAGVVAGREALHPGRRFIARPHDCGQTWELIDTRHPLAKTHGPRVVMSGFQSAETIKAEEQRNAAAAGPVFEFDGSRGSLAEYLKANADDAGLCEWLPTAAVGDTYAGCTRVA